MDLLIDIGNTRIKWAALEQQRLAQQHAAVYVDWDGSQIREQMLNKLSRPTRVLIANVGGDRIGALLADTIEKACGVKAQFVYSTASAAGVRAGYQHPEKLGVDRWLGVIAAYHLEHRATCVVSVGTAMTVDGVDGTGQHLGGIIVPGPDLMLSSLHRGTSDIAVRSQDGNEGSELFADNTQAAVNQGITHTLAALVERASYDIQSRFGEMPALLVTGGASHRITGALRVPFRLIPDLVLRGLAELARA